MFTNASKLKAQQTRYDHMEHRYMSIVESLVREGYFFRSYLTTKGSYKVFAYYHPSVPEYCPDPDERRLFNAQIRRHIKAGTLCRVDRFDGEELCIEYERVND